uniref:mRNA (guanine-N(7))-methyltransferase n=1 Tax=Fagus sylvatica TaxID=28930 RepID=A0A2N9HLD0_FAGSY
MSTYPKRTESRAMHTGLLASSHPSGLQLAASFSTPYTTEPSLREGGQGERKGIMEGVGGAQMNRPVVTWRILTEGLVFGNSVYWIRFDEEFSEKKFKSSSPFGIKYKFHLEVLLIIKYVCYLVMVHVSPDSMVGFHVKDAVDCPEWVVPFHVFKALAEEYDLELVFAKNSHEFVHEYLKRPEYVDLMRRLGALGDGNQDKSTLSQDEWEVAYLYLAFVLKKVYFVFFSARPTRPDTGQTTEKTGTDEYIKGRTSCTLVDEATGWMHFKNRF